MESAEEAKKMTTTDERNFRSSYYEKVGFRSVEEKKSLEILLKDKPLDRTKLMQFCLRFTLPGIYRNLLWKLLLGVLPVHIDSHKYVWDQRQMQYDNLMEALIVMKLVNPKEMPKQQVFLLMWLLETGCLKFDWEIQFDDPLNKHLMQISSALLNIFEDDVDIYWISKAFYTKVVTFYDSLPKLSECSKSYLEKEDQPLHSYLTSIGALEAIPFNNWFCCCFSGILQETALTKIWDKMAAGSCKILVFVAVVVLTTLRRSLMSCRSSENILTCLGSICEETSDVIANKAIELWQQYGSCLTPSSGPEALKIHPVVTRNKTSAAV